MPGVEDIKTIVEDVKKGMTRGLDATRKEFQNLRTGRASIALVEGIQVDYFNTPTPLDIAYAQTDGTIVTIRTMKPFDTSTYSSVFPAKFALEVKAGTFKELGIFEGDKIMLPDGL